MSTTVRVASPAEPALQDRADDRDKAEHPPLETVSGGTTVGATARTADQRLGRAVIVGCLIGVVSMTGLGFVIGIIAGAERRGCTGHGPLLCVLGRPGIRVHDRRRLCRDARRAA